MIRLEHISKVFEIDGRRVQALDDVSLHVPAGQIVGVIGASGAGKSTLIRTVNLLETPTSGRVVVDSQELTGLSEKDLIGVRRQIAMIFQHFNLLANRTVAGNVAVPLELAGVKKADIQARVAELLKLVGLEHRAQAYPAQLSGGQKQRVAIARALATNPKVLLCDEATSALDPATTQSILSLLKTINTQLGLTILLITHEMDVVKRICDQVAILEGGRIVEDGPVASVFAKPKSQLAKDFISSTLHIELPAEYKARLHAQSSESHHCPVLKIEFTGDTVDEPLLSLATQQFGVSFNIFTSQIDYAGGVKFGFVVAEVLGDPEAVDKATTYLSDHHVNVEVLGYV